MILWALTCSVIWLTERFGFADRTSIVQGYITLDRPVLIANRSRLDIKALYTEHHMVSWPYFSQIESAWSMEQGNLGKLFWLQVCYEII